MSVDRRKLFALGGAGAIAGADGKLGPEFNLHGGLTIHVIRDSEGWKVAVPDWEYVNRWLLRPGNIPPIKMIPVAEFFAQFDKEWDA